MQKRRQPISLGNPRQERRQVAQSVQTTKPAKKVDLLNYTPPVRGRPETLIGGGSR